VFLNQVQCGRDVSYLLLDAYLKGENSDDKGEKKKEDEAKIDVEEVLSGHMTNWTGFVLLLLLRN
jgi:hypothetical protein